MTQSEFRDWAIGQGWTEDRFRHLKKGEYRFKLQAISVRLEKLLIYSLPLNRSTKQWIRIRSQYYSKLTVNPVTNKLEGMNA